MQQVCLNLHQSGSDRLFFTTFLTLSKAASLDIIPLISGQSSSASPQTHIVHTILAFVHLGVKDLVPLLINKISNPSFSSISKKTSLSKDGWIMRVLNLKGVSLEAGDYDALITPLSASCRAQLVKKCCDEGAHLNFVKQAVLNSYDTGTLHEMMLFLLQQAKNLSASDYVDDCLLHTCPTLPGEKILALVRLLTDHSLLNSYQQKFWMIVAYDKKENCEDLAMDILRELYGDRDGSMYFSIHDLNNLVQLVSSDKIRQELLQRANVMESALEEFESSVLQKEDTCTLLNSNLSLQLLKENHLMYKIAQIFGIHTTVAALQTVTEVSKNCNDLGELLKQIEVNEDYGMMKSVLTYYGFLLPPHMRDYCERKLIKKRKLKKASYERLTEIQLYLYSYLLHMPFDEETMAMLQNRLNENEIVHLLMVHHVLNRQGTNSAVTLLNLPTVCSRRLSKKDKELLLHIGREENKLETLVEQKDREASLHQK